MRKFLLASLLLLIALPFGWGEKVQDLPRPTNYVSDFAGVLSQDTQDSLNALCTQVDRQAHAQIAVVTIKSLDDQPIENFATELEDKWKVGKKGTDRGLLIIFAPNDRKYRFEVGYGLEGILNDGRVGDIGRAMVPYLQQNNYDAAVTMAVQQVSDIIAADAGVTLSTATPRLQYAPVQQAKPLTLGQLLILGIVLLFVIFFLARVGGGGLLGFLIGMFLGGGGGGNYRGGGGGGFGGGDGGGGGFGGFGGGSSGGGGASGSW